MPPETNSVQNAATDEAAAAAEKQKREDRAAVTKGPSGLATTKQLSSSGHEAKTRGRNSRLLLLRNKFSRILISTLAWWIVVWIVSAAWNHLTYQTLSLSGIDNPQLDLKRVRSYEFLLDVVLYLIP